MERYQECPSKFLEQNLLIVVFNSKVQKRRVDGMRILVRLPALYHINKGWFLFRGEGYSWHGRGD
ncbi:MAG: hypothetical protein A2W09_06435 [Deltaproteobacteria bacterium RBG_16_50_11]|nr:MAG: hypothetical protein A2W09_06435 [Deltaproteobacteria bacterium RBG_16_50_11]